MVCARTPTSNGCAAKAFEQLGTHERHWRPWTNMQIQRRRVPFAVRIVGTVSRSALASRRRFHASVDRGPRTGPGPPSVARRPTLRSAGTPTPADLDRLLESYPEDPFLYHVMATCGSVTLTSLCDWGKGSRGSSRISSRHAQQHRLAIRDRLHRPIARSERCHTSGRPSSLPEATRCCNICWVWFCTGMATWSWAIDCGRKPRSWARARTLSIFLAMCHQELGDPAQGRIALIVPCF